MAKRERKPMSVPSFGDLGKYSTATITGIADNAQNIPEAIGVNDDNGRHENIDIYSIELNPSNDLYREEDDDDAIEGMASSIEGSTMLHNIVVSQRADGKYMMLSGERRLRSYYLLDKRYQDGKYKTIEAKIYTGLSNIQEVIMLDSANLIARGRSHKDEKRVRKAVNRLVQNLKKEYKITEEQAAQLVVRHTGGQTSEAVVSRNLTIEKELHPLLLEMLDKGEISKVNSELYVKLTPAEQSHIAECYQAATSPEARDQLTTDIVHSIKNSRPLPPVPERVAPAKKSIRAESGVKTQKEKRIDALKRKGDNLSSIVQSITSKQDFILSNREAFDDGDNSLVSQIKDSISELEKLVDAIG